MSIQRWIAIDILYLLETIMDLVVKKQPLHVSKHARFEADGGVCEFIKRVWEYNLRKKQEASAIIGRCVVSSTTPSDVQEDTRTLP